MAEPANVIEKEAPAAKEKPEAVVAPSGPAVSLGNRFQIFPSTPVPEMSTATVRAYVATDERDPGMPRVALICGTDLPARLEGAKAMKSIDRPGLLRLHDFGLVDWPGTTGKRLAMIYEFPEGGLLWNQNGPRDAWPPPRLITHLLHPLSAALAEMFLRNVIHRALRPQNLFWLDQARTRVVLGPCLAVPPGYDQPAAFETIEGAMCDPEGARRGQPCGRHVRARHDADGLRAGLDAGDRPRSRGGDLAAHRAQLVRLDGRPAEAARGRHGGDARPHQRLGGRPLDGRAAARLDRRQAPADDADGPARCCAPPRVSGSAGREYKNARDLAHGLGKRWETAARELRSGNIQMWARNTLGDQKLHDRLAAAVNEPTGDPNPTFNDATIVARCCILLDPMAPIRFRGHSVTLDGLGSALASAMRKPGMGPVFADMIRAARHRRLGAFPQDGPAASTARPTASSSACRNGSTIRLPATASSAASTSSTPTCRASRSSRPACGCPSPTMCSRRSRPRRARTASRSTATSRPSSPCTRAQTRARSRR